MDTRNAVVRKIRGLIYILESGEAQEVQIPLISILLQITDFESDGNGALQSEWVSAVWTSANKSNESFKNSYHQPALETALAGL